MARVRGSAGRYRELRAKIELGAVANHDDLVANNLDIRQFVQDVIANCEGTDLLWAFYQAIEQITVLDPTCGSGAFDFAALNVLEPLYEVCLGRMQGFVDDADRSAASQGDDHRRPVHRHHDNFRVVLARVAAHPSRRYFIYKSIIMNNLYGADIMEEAVEICKLRLFLKLMSQVDDVAHLEPLPDIDFNIRAGNTLVGFTNYAGGSALT
jgi:type II restriction/modification system DNA methylase subunit YeeA